MCSTRPPIKRTKDPRGNIAETMGVEGLVMGLLFIPGVAQDNITVITGHKAMLDDLRIISTKNGWSRVMFGAIGHLRQLQSCLED
jgi:hypothetical protein